MVREPVHSTFEYLIGGSPCGGTTFMSILLTKLGFPCSHEAVYAADGKLWMNPQGGFWSNGLHPVKQSDSIKADSSYTVGEWMDLEEVKHLPVIALVRHPIKTLNSLIAYEFSQLQVIDVNWVIKTMLGRWNKLIESPRLAMVCRIEKDIPALCEMLGVKYQNLDGVFRNPHNHGKIQLTLDDFRICDEYDNLVAFLKKHYE
jgi:hypothetical protein